MQVSGNICRFLCGHRLGPRRIAADQLFIMCATRAAAVPSPLDGLLCIVFNYCKKQKGSEALESFFPPLP